MAMNFGEERFIRHAEDVVKKKERIETLEALVATHEAMGAEPDSPNIKEPKTTHQSGTNAAHGHPLKSAFPQSAPTPVDFVS